jgi:SAM-dependent methyltransferase
MNKRYDRAYFDKWYRDRQSRVHQPGEVRRKAAMAIASTEYFLRRPIRDALDVGCGEAPWRTHLRAFRPRLAYQGVDPSEYVVERFGEERNIRQASFGELPSLRLPQFDLVICADVLHYVPDTEIRTGLSEIARLCEGIAFLEVLTAEDEIVGDLQGIIRRPASFYRKTLAKLGMRQIGPYMWLGAGLSDAIAELEKVD